MQAKPLETIFVLIFCDYVASYAAYYNKMDYINQQRNGFEHHRRSHTTRPPSYVSSASHHGRHAFSHLDNGVKVRHHHAERVNHPYVDRVSEQLESMKNSMRDLESDWNLLSDNDELEEFEDDDEWQTKDDDIWVSFSREVYT